MLVASLAYIFLSSHQKHLNFPLGNCPHLSFKISPAPDFSNCCRNEYTGDPILASKKHGGICWVFSRKEASSWFPSLGTVQVMVSYCTWREYSKDVESGTAAAFLSENEEQGGNEPVTGRRAEANESQRSRSSTR